MPKPETITINTRGIYTFLKYYTVFDYVNSIYCQRKIAYKRKKKLRSQQEFENATGKQAVWRGKITKEFKDWQNEPISEQWSCTLGVEDDKGYQANILAVADIIDIDYSEGYPLESFNFPRNKYEREKFSMKFKLPIRCISGKKPQSDGMKDAKTVLVCTESGAHKSLEEKVAMRELRKKLVEKHTK